MFDQNIKSLIPEVPNIKNQGFDILLISPLQSHKPINHDYEFQEWFKYYQVLGFEIGNDLGTKEDLKNLSTECHKYGLLLMEDIICNHTAGDDYNHLEPHDMVDKRLKENRWFWKPKRNIQNWNNRWEVENLCA